MAWPRRSRSRKTPHPAPRAGSPRRRAGSAGPQRCRPGRRRRREARSRLDDGLTGDDALLHVGHLRGPLPVQLAQPVELPVQPLDLGGEGPQVADGDGGRLQRGVDTGHVLGSDPGLEGGELLAVAAVDVVEPFELAVQRSDVGRQAFELAHDPEEGVEGGRRSRPSTRPPRRLSPGRRRGHAARPPVASTSDRSSAATWPTSARSSSSERRPRCGPRPPPVPRHAGGRPRPPGRALGTGLRRRRAGTAARRFGRRPPQARRPPPPLCRPGRRPPARACGRCPRCRSAPTRGQLQRVGHRAVPHGRSAWCRPARWHQVVELDNDPGDLPGQHLELAEPGGQPAGELLHPDPGVVEAQAKLVEGVAVGGRGRCPGPQSRSSTSPTVATTRPSSRYIPSSSPARGSALPSLRRRSSSADWPSWDTASMQLAGLVQRRLLLLDLAASRFTSAR